MLLYRQSRQRRRKWTGRGELSCSALSPPLASLLCPSSCAATSVRDNLHQRAQGDCECSAGHLHQLGAVEAHRLRAQPRPAAHRQSIGVSSRTFSQYRSQLLARSPLLTTWSPRLFCFFATAGSRPAVQRVREAAVRGDARADGLPRRGDEPHAGHGEGGAAGRQAGRRR